MCRCTKVGALLLTPLLVHGKSEPRAAATLSRAEEGGRREAGAQDGRGNAKTRNTKDQEGEVDSPDKALAGATCPMRAERATLEPKGSKRHHQLHWNQGSGGTSVVACRSLSRS